MNLYFFRNTQPFSFLDKSTRPILQFVVLALLANDIHIAYGLKSDILEYKPLVSRKPWSVMSPDAKLNNIKVDKYGAHCS